MSSLGKLAKTVQMWHAFWVKFFSKTMDSSKHINNAEIQTLQRKYSDEKLALRDVLYKF